MSYRFHIHDQEKNKWLTFPARVDCFCDLYTLEQVKRHIDYWYGKRKWDARIEHIDGAMVKTYYPDDFANLFACIKENQELKENQHEKHY